MAWLRALEPDDQGRRRFEVLSPKDGTVNRELTCSNADDVAAAMARARAAQKRWGQTPVKERVRLMDRALGVLCDRQDEFMDAVHAETGRPRVELMTMTILAVADTMNFYSRHAKKSLADQNSGVHLMRTKKARVVFKPMGVIAVISPWNGPFALSMSATIQAVLAGNAVLVKPSEATPVSGGDLVEMLFRDAGFPEHLVQVVQGDGATGAALIAAEPDKVCFTGSVPTGRKVASACAERLIPCTLELGGKNAMIVCADADIERAAGVAIFGGMMNAGQFCDGIERVYVIEEVADAFTAKVVELASALEIGRDIGPCIYEPQLDIIQRHVQDAVDKGAKVHVGGARNGRYYPPTVMTGVTHEMELMTEETFGPVIPIMRVANEDEALRMANDSRFGLGASVFTKDKKRAHQIATRLDTGSVNINDQSVTFGALEVPFGGRKNSGVGSVNGAYGLRNFTNAQPILTERLAPKTEWHWFPYTDEKLEKLSKATAWMFRTPIRWLLR